MSILAIGISIKQEFVFIKKRMQIKFLRGFLAFIQSYKSTFSYFLQ